MDLATARRHAVLSEFIRPYQSHEDIGGFDAEAMADRIVRLERIIHALREPSESVVHTAVEASLSYHTTMSFGELRVHDLARASRDWGAVHHAIRAAVAAAEREVGA